MLLCKECGNLFENDFPLRFCSHICCNTYYERNNQQIIFSRKEFEILMTKVKELKNK